MFRCRNAKAVLVCRPRSLKLEVLKDNKQERGMTEEVSRVMGKQQKTLLREKKERRGRGRYGKGLSKVESLKVR